MTNLEKELNSINEKYITTFETLIKEIWLQGHKAGFNEAIERVMQKLTQNQEVKNV